MKVFTPEISWHNHGPILCLDVQPIEAVASPDAQIKLRGHHLRSYRIATGGNDQNVYIWMVSYNDSRPEKQPHIEVRTALRRHQKTVGSLRFSPSPAPKSQFDNSKFEEVLKESNEIDNSDNKSLSDVSQKENDQNENLKIIITNKSSSGNNKVALKTITKTMDTNAKPSRPLRLASGDDDGYIIIWQYQAEESNNNKNRFGNDMQASTWESNAFGSEDCNVEQLETWKQFKVLRGHIEDICDLSWSKDGSQLLSGSVDNSAIIWDVDKATKLWMCDGSRGFVHGVTFDPHNEYVVTISSDRNLRIYDVKGKKLHLKVRQSLIQYRNIVKCKATYVDDTLKSFCRRLEFSPCGEFLLVPSGVIQMPDLQPSTSELLSTSVLNGSGIGAGLPVTQKSIEAAFLYRRNCLAKPCCYYPSGGQSALCVRFCPVYFKLRAHEQNLLNLPYRIVFAIATSRSILIYDTQQTMPIGYLSQIHLARLTDLSWSHDARLLMISSYDAYSSLVMFEPNEFGEPYEGPRFIPQPIMPVDKLEKATMKNGERTPKTERAPRAERTPRASAATASAIDSRTPIKAAAPSPPSIKTSADKTNHKLTKWLTVSPKAPPTKRLKES